MSEEINVTLAPERLTVVPGESASATVTVRNTGKVVEAYSVVLEGIDPKWGTLDVSSTNLFPGDEESFELTIRPPRTSSSRAGDYEVRVNVSSRRDPSVRTIATLPVKVEEFSQFEVGLRPGTAKARKGTYTLSISNSGNSPASYSLSGQDDQKLCHFLFDDGVNYVEVQPGTTREVKVMTDPIRKPIAWSPQTHQFRVSVLPQGEEGAEAREVEAELQCIPRVSRSGVLAGIGTLLVVVALLVSAYQFHWGGLGGATYELQVTYKLNSENAENGQQLEAALQDIIDKYKAEPEKKTEAYNVTVIPVQEGKDREELLYKRVVSLPVALVQYLKENGMQVARVAIRFSINDECDDKEIPLLTKDLFDYIDWVYNPWYNKEDSSFRFWTITIDIPEDSQLTHDTLNKHFEKLVDHFTGYRQCITTSYWFRVVGKENTKPVEATNKALESFSRDQQYNVKVSDEESHRTKRVKVTLTINSEDKTDLEQNLAGIKDNYGKKNGIIIWEHDATYVTPEIEAFTPPK